MDELTAAAVFARLRSLESRPEVQMDSAVFDEMRALSEHLLAREAAERQAVEAENLRIAHASWGDLCSAWRTALNPLTRPATPHRLQTMQPHAGAHASPPRGGFDG